MKQGKRKAVVPNAVRRKRVGYQEKLLVLHSHALQLNAAPTIEMIAECTLNAMQSALGFDFADILFPEQGCLQIKGSRGMDATFLEIPLDGRGVVVKAARKKATIRISDVRKEPAYVDRMGFNWIGKASMLSELAAPVILDREAVAVLNVESKRLNAFSDEDQKLLETLGTHVGSAISRLRRDEERKQIEQTLRRSEEKIRGVLSALPDLVFEISPEGLFTDYHAQIPGDLAYRPEEFLGKSVRNVLPLTVAAPIEAAMTAARTTGAVQTVEYQLPSLKGKLADWEARIVQLSDGTFIDVVRNITERKRMEETLSRRAEELQALQATVLDITRRQDLPTLLNAIVERAAGLVGAPSGGMYRCDPDMHEVRCAVGYNTRISPVGTVLKYGEGAAGKVAQNGQPLIIEDYRTWEGRAAAYEKDQPFRAVLSAPMLWEGQVIGVIEVLNDEAGYFTASDLRLLELFANHAAIAVESTQAQEQLRRRAEELAALEATVLDIAGSSHDLPSLLEVIVKRAVSLLDAKSGGLDLCDSEKREVRCVVSYNTPRDFRGLVLKYGEGSSGRVAETGEPLIIDDYRNWEGAAGISGATELGAQISVPMIWRGQVTGVIQVTEDSATRHFTQSDLNLLMLFANHAAIAVENERHSENLAHLIEERTTDLRNSEAKYRSVVQNIPVMVWTSDQEGNTLFITPNVEKVFGFTPQQIYGQGYALWANRIHPEDLPKLERDYGLLFTDGKLFDVEYRFQRTDGKWVWLHDRADKTYEVNGVRYADGVTTNINERKEIEERLRKAERLAAIGETAAMVGHDLRNPLQAISAASYVLEKKLTPSADEKVKEMLEAIENSVQHSDRIVDDLLGYSEDMQLELSETTPKSIARDALLHVKIPASISVLDLTSDEPKLRVDGLKFRRLFINLIKMRSNPCQTAANSS